MNGLNYQPGKIDWDAVAKNNFNWAERLFREGLSIRYDEDGDTLLCTIGIDNSYQAVTEEVMDNIYLRIVPDSLIMVGLMVLNFATDFLANNKLARKSLGAWFQDLRSGGGTATLEGNEAKRAEPFFELAMAR